MLENVYIELEKFRKLKYYNKEYTFYFDNRKISNSVTKMVNTFKKPFDEEFFSKRVAAKEGITQKEVRARWKEKRDASTTLGKVIHDYIENLFKNRVVKISPEYIEYQNVVDRLYNDIEGLLIPIKSELIIGSPSLDVAGIADQLFYSPKYDELQIWDWKTNEKFTTKNDYGNFLLGPFKEYEECDLNTHSIQLNLLKLIIEDMTNLKIAKTCICHINKTGYQVYTCKDFQNILKEEVFKIPAYDECGNLIIKGSIDPSIA